MLIVDDHALFRRGLEMVLGRGGRHRAGRRGQRRRRGGRRRPPRLLPDVVLMDIRMPRRSGIEACTAMKEVAPSTKIVMLTISDEEADLFEAIRRAPAATCSRTSRGRGRRRRPRGARRPVADQPVDGGQAAHRVRRRWPAGRRRPAEQVPAPRLTDREMRGAQAGRHAA